MSAPSVPVDVLNLALMYLNQNPVVALNDPNNPATVFAPMIYDQRRRALIRNFNFNFSRTQGSLKLDPLKTPNFDYNYTYRMPDDCLKIISVGAESSLADTTKIVYDILGRNVIILGESISSINTSTYGTATPPTDIDCLYHADVIDITLMDPLFIDVLALDMAAQLAMPIFGDPGIAAALEQKMQRSLAEAVTINHQERPIRVIETDYIGEARVLGGSLGVLPVNPTYWPT